MDELPMTNLNHPNGVSRKFYDLMQEIEKLPASEQQTRCCIKTSEVWAFVLAALNADRSAESERVKGPKVVCLCGSTRFKDAFDEANYRETMAGNIVLSVGFFMHASGNKHGEGVGATPEQKVALDELHKRKIDLADEVLILNVGGYIGSSTRSELDYAIAHGKPIRYLENRP